MNQRQLLVFYCFVGSLLCSPTLFAQVETYAEIGWLKPGDEITNDRTQTFKGETGLSIGADVLFGKSQVSPLVGAHVQLLRYENPLEQLDLWQLTLPLGVSYHLLPRTYSFNLMASLAVAPVIGVGAPESSIINDESLKFALRGGVTFTIDYAYFGFKAYALPSGRFGSADGLTWTNSFLAGVRF